MSMQKITDNLLEPLTIAFREYGRDLNDEKVDWKSYIRFCNQLLANTNGQNVSRLEYLSFLFDNMEAFFGRKKCSARVVKCMEQGFDWLDDELKDCKLLYTYRRSECIYLGWKKRWLREGHSIEKFYETRMPEILAELKNSKEMYHDEHDRLYTMHLDDIRSNTKCELSNLCTCLDIDWDDSLLAMTVNGIAFPGFHLDASRNNYKINPDEYDISELLGFERRAIAENGLYIEPD